MIETARAEVLQDVGPADGLVRVDGDCLVLGTIMDGARIEVIGSLRIEGGVEAAEVTAGGSVEILRGVSGNGGAHLRAGGDVTARFLDHATVRAGGDVTVGESILHCAVEAEGDVVVSPPRGIIAGGRTVAGGSVRAAVIGGAFGTATYVSAGLPPDLLRELEDLEAYRTQLAHELVAARTRLRLAKGEDDRIKEARYRLLVLRRQAREADEARRGLHARLAPRKNAMIVAQSNMRAGVRGRIAGAPYSVARDSGPSRVIRRGGRATVWPAG